MVPQIGQWHVGTILVDQLVNPKSALTGALSAPHLKHGEPAADISERYRTSRHDLSPQGDYAAPTAFQNGSPSAGPRRRT
jgi:hypothetical protein